MVTENVNTIDPRLAEMNMDEAPETTSFHYTGRLAVEEWTYLSLERRTRQDYVKPDVPYYHVAYQPLSYKISDGGMEGDGLEHTYAAMKNSQGELTPKGSARDELVKSFEKLGFQRKVVTDLTTASAIGKVFKVKRYNRVYAARTPGAEPIRGELMNVAVDFIGDDWQPAPGTEIPSYTRKPRVNSGGNGASVASGTVSRPIGVSLETVAKELASAGVNATEEAVRTFVLDRSDLAAGEILDFALAKTLLVKLVDDGKVVVTDGKVAVA